MTIGQRIKNRRLSLKLTQEDVATVVDVTKQTIQKYENNIITNIPSDKIELLAEVLRCTPGYLMGWEEKSAYDEMLDETIEDFKSLSDAGKQKVIDFIRMVKNDENNA